MGLVALERLRWGERWIEPGEPVPEGEPGRNYSLAEQLGQIGHDPGGLAQRAAQSAFGAPAAPGSTESPVAPGVELSKLKRAELDELAAEAGVESPKSVPSKAALIEAIEAAR